MEIYLIIVIVLFVLAISDLMVGVSNDAVNFLNSAIGSKVAPRYIIMVVASLGILVGTTFSSGLMEVARKGIFNPEMFFFEDIMIVFLAVMLTDVLLLDLFNTFGLPTSTTVSIVFELLGSAVAIAVIKVIEAGNGIEGVIEFINTSKALAIISGNCSFYSWCNSSISCKINIHFRFYVEIETFRRVVGWNFIKLYYLFYFG